MGHMIQMRFTFQDQALVSMVAAYFGFFRLHHGESMSEVLAVLGVEYAGCLNHF